MMEFAYLSINPEGGARPDCALTVGAAVGNTIVGHLSLERNELWGVHVAYFYGVKILAF